MFVESIENSKRKSYQSDLLSLYVFWYEWNNFRVYVFFTSMHVLNSMFWVYVIRISNKIGKIIWLEIIILRSPEKRVPWKFWLDPRFPWNPKLKWILKWLPLDKGYFKFYFFTKGESLLIISCHIYLLTRNFVIFISIRVCITMHFIPVKCLVFRYYWSIIPRKRGSRGNFGSILNFPGIPN